MMRTIKETTETENDVGRCCIRFHSDFRTRRVTLYEVARRIRRPLNRSRAMARIQAGEVVRVSGKFEAWRE